MPEEPDVIRHQIEETRESLSEKLGTLEARVSEAVGTVTDTIETVKSTVENTVDSVKSGVTDTVESVKTSLSDTVDSVKETFDVPLQVERHPWAALGCSFVTGVATGYLLEGLRQSRSYHSLGIRGMGQVIPGYRTERPAETPQSDHRATESSPGFLTTLLGSFEGELGKIKQTAIGALVGAARDMIKQSLPPSLGENVTEIMDNVARRVGGEPVRGPVLQPERSGTEHDARRAAY